MARRVAILALLAIVLIAQSGWFYLLGRWMTWTLWGLARAASGI
jgi:hypothetical protein